jgi:WD40 repeat protein
MHYPINFGLPLTWLNSKQALPVIVFIAFAGLANSAIGQSVENFDKLSVQPPSVLTADLSFKSERSWPAHSQWIRAIAFNTSGDRLISVSDDDRLIVWDCATGNPILELSGNVGGFTCLTLPTSFDFKKRRRVACRQGATASF